MINTILNVDDICQDCPYFSTETNHTTNYDGTHMIYIFCEHHELCNHLRNAIRIWSMKVTLRWVVVEDLLAVQKLQIIC